MLYGRYSTAIFFCFALFLCGMSKLDSETHAALALTFIPGIGPNKAKNLIAFCGSAESIFREKKSALLKIPDIGPHTAKALQHTAPYFQRADQEMEFIKRFNIGVHFYYEEHYPQRLRQCDDSPVILFSKGNANLNAERCVSVVGTRSATSYGKQLVLELLKSLLPFQPLVVSGLAYGVDIHAHRACLQLGLPTVACLAHGLDRIYPATHHETAKEMLEFGGLLTEFPSMTNPDRELFPSRNRIIAGISECTIVVETDSKGGSIITANLANSYGRDVFAYPGRVFDKHSKGCNDLIRSNTAAILTDPEEIVDCLGWSPEKRKTPTQMVLFSEFSTEEQLVVGVLREKRRLPMDKISHLTALPLPRVSTLLLELEFRGVVKSLPGMMYDLLDSLTFEV
jgi:DNA processing protein